jgi:hypothetical protein
LFAGKFLDLIYFLRLYCLNFVQNVFFKLLTLFLCFLYLSISDCLLYFFAVLRIRSRILISLLSSLLNHGRSLLCTVTILVGMHSLATLENVSVKVLHISSTSSESESNAFQSTVSLYIIGVTAGVMVTIVVLIIIVIASIVVKTTVCIINDGMYCQRRYVLPTTVCITNDSIYYTRRYVLHTAVCITNDCMYYTQRYVLNTTVWVAHNIMYYQRRYALPTTVCIIHDGMHYALRYVLHTMVCITDPAM